MVAWTIASGIYFNTTASFIRSLLFLCFIDPSFFSRSLIALNKSIGSTGIILFRFKSFKADFRLRVIIKINLFWL